MYFITAKTTETGKKFQAIADRADAIQEQQIALANEIGFDEWRNGHWSVFGGFSSLIFKETPDLKIYKEVYSNEYMPRLSSKKGKEIKSKLDSCDTIEPNELNDCIGFKGAPIRHIGFRMNNEHYFGFSAKDHWDINIPSDCEEVTASRYKELFNL